MNFLVSRLWLYFGFEYQLQTSVAQYLSIWVAAYWFFATSFSKLPPGGHIGFFGFWTLYVAWFPECKSSLLWDFNFKLHMHVDGGHRQKPIDFQWRHFQNGCLVAILVFFLFQTPTLVWPWISTPNLSGTMLMYMCKTLLIFSNINFKMAARRPYWIFLCPDSNFSLALNINSKLMLHNTCIYG